MKSIKYSWVIPIRNEAQSLPQLLKEIRQSMGNKKYEVIAVNDASTDNSLSILGDLKKKYSKLKVLSFDMPRGKWDALQAGFKASKGQIVITIDGDLQNNPMEIQLFLDKVNEGYDLVSGYRTIFGISQYEKSMSQWGNKIVGFFYPTPFRDLNSAFKVYKKSILSDFQLPGRLWRFVMIEAYRRGLKVAEVPIKNRQRKYGESKFSNLKYFAMVFDLIQYHNRS